MFEQKTILLFFSGIFIFTFQNYKLGNSACWNIKKIAITTMRDRMKLMKSQRKALNQYIVGITPLTYCKCFDFVAFSSIKNRTKLAGMKPKANIMKSATIISLINFLINSFESCALVFFHGCE